MYKVTHNIPRTMQRKYRAAIANYPSQLRAVIDATGGAYARGNHDYNNQTGNLESKTRAYIVSANFGGVTVELAARTPYAKYVARHGLLNLAEAARIARAAIARFHRLLLR